MTDRIHVTRSLTVPDEQRVARCRRTPDLGPRLTFFSGGTALKGFSQKLIEYTHNSVHLITPFDSGGSSAKLRAAYGMLAVGDLRNRLMALADRSFKGNPEIYALFGHRLPKDAPRPALHARLVDMVEGRDPLVAAVPDPMRKIIRSHLGFFLEHLTDAFDLRGASIGNLILTGGFFNYGRHIDPVIYLFSKLVEARGTVRPICNVDLHLVAELEDGTVLVGQHLLTGKEAAPIASPIKRIWLTDDKASLRPVVPEIRQKIRKLIARSDLIVFPVGSFYSSLVANLLPHGVGAAIAGCACPKVHVPNCAGDPEQHGLTLVDSVARLIAALKAGHGGDAPTDRLLNFVLLDAERGRYAGPWSVEALEALGVEVIDARLITDQSAPYYDEERLIACLLSLA